MTTQVINRTVVFEKRLHHLECCACSVDFALGANFIAERRKDKGTFYCPNGHPQGYFGPSDEEKRATKAEAERDAARSLAERESRRRVNAEADARRAEYQRRAAKGQLTKVRKRIAAGVCPCCNRTFQNVLNHIAGQHPEFIAEARQAVST